jgi:catechol 2,3-dioxygenase-like lactoylglutathione lyase family enzyme
MVQIRYIVKDVDASIAFYESCLGFRLVQKFGPAMAILAFGDLTLWVAGPLSSAGKTLPGGEQPSSGGWSRFVLSVDDLPDRVSKLKAKGVRFRSEIISGPGGRQILCDDPSGNPIELFEAAR